MDDMLDSFDHVVVLMLENRSFDNILGYLYPDGVPDNAPLGKTFNGVAGKDLSNPVPPDVMDPPEDDQPIKVAKTRNYHQPYPDPGEEYYHVNTQIFNYRKGGDHAPYNLPEKLQPPYMQGFVNDYAHHYVKETKGHQPSLEEYSQIMYCFDPEAVPVMSTLAQEFAVFDQWYCAVPSQTWCNRAFWHAGTSWGHVENGGTGLGNTISWIKDSVGDTIFNQIEQSNSDLNWKVYSQNPVALTSIIHLRALDEFHVGPKKRIFGLEDFFDDCKKGKLPAYSFLEPRFWTPHNDMHPSTWKSKHYGPDKAGTVLLGEHLVWQVYNAVKNASSSTGSNWQNTLLIITFDEHGGCYDHVLPPRTISPNLEKYKKYERFEFDRLGIRVPMIMVSAHIAPNTVVNDKKDHCSFLKTMQQKWSKTAPGKFPDLSARQAAAADFSEVFTAEQQRDRRQWPEIAEPQLPQDFTNYASDPLSDLQHSMVKILMHRHPHLKSEVSCQTDAIKVLHQFKAEKEQAVKSE